MTENEHVPSDAFRANLEWQVRTALRRDARFAAPVQSDRRRMRSVVVLLIGLMLGAGAAVASAQVRDARDRAALLESIDVERRLAMLAMELRKSELALVRRRFEAGVVGRESLAQAETDLRAAELKLNRIQLNMDEVNATGAAPRDEISAPLAGRRDFVKERLHLDLVLAQQKLTMAEQAAAETERRVQVGAVDQMAALQARTELSRARGDLQLLVHTLQLREQFLAEKQQPAEVTHALHRLRVQAELQHVQLQHVLQRQRLELMRERQRVGAVTELDVLRAEVALAETAAQLAALQAQVQLLRESPRRDTTATPLPAPS